MFEIVDIEDTALGLPIADLDQELKENGHFQTSSPMQVLPRWLIASDAHVGV